MPVDITYMTSYEFLKQINRHHEQITTTTESYNQMYHYPKDCFVRGIFNDIPYTAYALKHVSLNQANQTIFVHVRKDKMLKIHKETVYRLSYHINFSDKLMI